MSRLIPTQVVDKNGRTTTVHKKASVSPSGSKLGELAPSLGKAPRSKAFTPTAQQLKSERNAFGVHAAKVDPGLHPLLPHGWNTTAITINASDVDLYAALGNIADTSNAIACFSVNDGVPDEVFLREHKLSHLGNTDPSRTELIQAALERRIPAKEFAVFDLKFSAYSDMPTYLDAAHAYSIPTLQKIPDFAHEVRRGNIKLDDVMTVGMKAIGTLKRSFGAVKTREMLASLADGTANYTAEQLKAVFGRCRANSASFVAMQLIEEYGGEYAASISDFELAHNISMLWGHDQEGSLGDAVSYADRFRQKTFRNHKQVYDLYMAGVDLDFAVEHSRKLDAISTHQIIAMHEGITKPLTQGWL